jgi:uncharacterized protein YndB with AHSA1/START domain
LRPVQASISIDAPRERVFELIADLGRRPAFCDHFQHDYRLERIAARGVGAAARFRMDASRFPIWMETVVEELHQPDRVAERGRGGRWDRIPVVTAWELAAGPGRGCEATVTFWTDPSHPLDIARERLGARRWYRRQWAKALQRLRELAESERPVEPIAVAGASRL